MVGVVTALYDEAYLLIKQAVFQRIDGVGQYYLRIANVDVSIYLCRPGVQKPGRLKKWLRQHRFSQILVTGFAGALRAGFARGDVCDLTKIVTETGVKIWSTQSIENGFTIMSFSQPVFSADEKSDFYLTSGADLVDMESEKMQSILADSGIPYRLFRIVGDLPGDKVYLDREQCFRNFFTEKKLYRKAVILLKTGIINSWFIYRLKKKLQKQLFLAVKSRIH